MSLLGHDFQIIAAPWEEITIYCAGVIETWMENKVYVNQGRQSYACISRSK